MREKILAVLTAVMIVISIPSCVSASDMISDSTGETDTDIFSEMIAAGYENGEDPERIRQELDKQENSDSAAGGFTPKASSSYTPPAKTITYTRTGDQAADIVGVALTQVGYESSNGNSVYGEWMGINGSAWCAAFVSWCANRANIPSSIVRYQTTADRDWYKEKGLYKKSKYRGGSYKPKAGDLIFFSWNGNDYAQHIGIVSDTDSSKVYTVEGNSGDPGAVKKKYYSLGSEYVLGYACPEYVVQTPLKHTVKLTSEFPSEGIVKGTDFRITGTASSNYKVSRVKVRIYKGDSSTAERTYDSGSINVSSFDLSAANDTIDIRTLDIGNYTLKISITNPESATMASRTTSKSYSFKIVEKLLIEEDQDEDEDMLQDLKAPAEVTAELYGHDDIKATWSSVEGADGYYVYYRRSDWNDFRYLGSTTKLYYKRANLTDGARYCFRIHPYSVYKGEEYQDSSYRTSSYVYTLKQLSEPTVKAASSSEVRVYWNNISGESGYQIAKSEYSSRNFKIVRTVGSRYKSASVKASKNRTYYYKVRAYKTVNDKKIYGPWSKVKSYKLT